ncbi:MAG: cysteine hydrolase family protein [Bacilli bacterium]
MQCQADVLIVIDLQNGVCFDSEHLHKLPELLVLVNSRIKTFREKQKPIIFVQHTDEELRGGEYLWALHDELDVHSDDLFVSKQHANSFYQTNLQEMLQQLNVNAIELCGAQTEYCMDSTIKYAHGLGYKLYMVEKGTSTLNNDYMTASQTIDFYEGIWRNRFLTFFEDGKYID